MHSRLNDEEIEFHRPLSFSLSYYMASSQPAVPVIFSLWQKQKNKKIVSSSFSLLPAEASHLLLLLPGM